METRGARRVLENTDCATKLEDTREKYNELIFMQKLCSSRMEIFLHKKRGVRLYERFISIGIAEKWLVTRPTRRFVNGHFSNNIVVQEN